MNNPTQPKTTLKESAHVGSVVQEYMDNLLVELFPDVEDDIQLVETQIEPLTTEQRVVSELTLSDDATETVALSTPDVIEPVVEADVVPETSVASIPVIESNVETKTSTQTEASPVSEPLVETPDTETPTPEASQSVYAKPQDLRYPKAPVWAQAAFDVLLFDVCGLKLAVPMESLGKIIKVEHETNQLIGRPDWFIGAYIDGEQHLYVVDTAQYIMPEKGFNLARDGFDFVIQLQRSKWTLACKKVHSTVRLEPDQVKWRSQQGKRQWLSGTVIDHMCALVHVDSLIELLEKEAS